MYRVLCIFFLTQPTRRKQSFFTNMYIKNIEQVLVVCRIFLLFLLIYSLCLTNDYERLYVTNAKVKCFLMLCM